MKFFYYLMGVIAKKRNILFVMPVKEQKEILDGYGSAKDTIERAYYQYKCQMRLYGRVSWFIFNFCSMFGLIVFYLFLKCQKKNIKKSSVDAILFLEGKEETIVPDSLFKEFRKRINIKDSRISALDKKGWKFYKIIWKRYPFSFYFLFKMLIKMSIYSGLTSRYNSKALIVCAEYSFVSPAMTAFCKINGVEFINVMHGEKLFCIRDAYANFDRFYVWDKEYADLFISLNARPEQFIAECPAMFRIDRENSEIKYFCTYYLADESDEELINIIKCLRFIKSKGKSVAVRVHPRSVNSKHVQELLKGFVIEDNKNIPIEQSLASTEYAISLYSTVLAQAAQNRIKVVIDNVSKPKKYLQLEELGYVMLKKKPILLSDFLKEKVVSL